jgi:chorismate dehydratase
LNFCDAYRIIPDLAIASRGPVASVALFTSRDMRDVRSIALDTSSRTSVALTRIMCARVFGIEPVFEPHGPDLPSMLERADAALLIGDNALFLGGGPVRVGHGARERIVDVQKIDLGASWTSATGLPFVYAFWAGRPGVVSVEDVTLLRRTRDAAVTRPGEVASTYFPDDPARQAIAEVYLRDNIKYSLGSDERAGLERFYRYAEEAGVVARAVTPAFFESED